MITEIPKFKVHYFKTKSLDLKSLENVYQQSQEEIEHDYNPFKIQNIQNFNPTHERFFSLNEINYNSVAFNHKYHIYDMMTVYEQETKAQHERYVFIKYSPLVDPIRYMIGKYKTNIESTQVLPTINNAGDIHPKLTDVNNASYVDNFFSFLSSKLLNSHNFVNGLDYYGSFLGIQNKFKMNIIDDIEYLSDSDYFNENLNKMFTVSNSTTDEFMNFGSRNNKQKLIISDTSKRNITMEEIIIDAEEIQCEPSINSDMVYEKQDTKSNNGSSSSSESGSEANYSDVDDDDSKNRDDCSESESDSESDGHSDSQDDVSSEWESYASEESAKYAYINNFPVQLICLEKCDGTLDELFENHQIGCDEAASALLQIIMTLIVYQKAFHFTHNDLHTNNIMFVNTDVEYLFYKYKNTVYKVPTYGKIYKLIDFGRSIYRFQDKLFCSDSFANGGDAATQYNCEPYMNENKPRLDPNYSFDLCRLGCSIYDFIIDDDEDEEEYDELQATISRWCSDDNGKNILYKRNGEERYPNFKLYKMIARTVHNHTPQEQLEFEYFSQFALSPKKTKVVDREYIMDINEIPCYV
jgi:hypothetical protein